MRTAIKKTCTTCNQTRPKNMFSMARAAKDGLCRICKDCESDMIREARDAMRTRLGAYR